MSGLPFPALPISYMLNCQCPADCAARSVFTLPIFHLFIALFASLRTAQRAEDPFGNLRAGSALHQRNVASLAIRY